MAFYAGLGPMAWFWRERIPSDSAVKHHLHQALALFSLLIGIALVSFVSFVACSFILVFQRGLYEALPLEGALDAVMEMLLVVWLVLYGYGVILAIRGSTRQIWLTGRLVGKIKILATTAILSLAIYAGIFVTALLAVRSTQLAKNDTSSARCYMVYDDIGFIPRWVYTLGFYRIAEAGTQRWGAGSVSVAPLTRANLESALQNGSFIFVASHGDGFGGGIHIPRETPYEPVDARWTNRGPDLQFVYITACDGGMDQQEWESALAPAEVKTFARLSAVAEHIYWLWFEGPAKVHSLESLSPVDDKPL